MRTHFDRFLDYIKASAAFHQYQRETEGEYILAKAPEDYEIARIALIQSTSNKFMIPLTKKQKQIFEVVLEHFKDMWFSVPELSDKAKFLSESKLYDQMDRLQEHFFDLDRQDRENSKKPVKVYRLRETAHIDIPTWEDIRCRKAGIEEVKKVEGDKGIEEVDTNNSLNSLNSPPKLPSDFQKLLDFIKSGGKIGQIKGYFENRNWGVDCL
jgi:hypothetical protein